MTRHTAYQHASTRSVAGVALLGVLVSAGCQQYERRSLDTAATREAWLARSPADESVRAFAQRLSADGAQPGHFDPSDGLTLPEAEAVALVFNPELRQVRLEAGVATAEAEFSGLWEDPVLSVDMERIVRGAGGANPWVVGGTIGLTIPLSGRLEAAKARADAHVRAQLDRAAAREWATRSALRELWIEWSAARGRAAISRDFAARLAEVTGLAERQEQAGLMSRLDARLFRVELAERQADLISLDAREKELELQLQAMLGLAPSASVELVPMVNHAAPAFEDESRLREALEQSSPELTAVRSQYEVAEESLRTEVRKQYPDLVIGPGYGRDQGDDRVLLGVQVPIPLWNRNQLGVAKTTAEREAARGRFETTYEQLASKLAGALVRHQAGRSLREAVESEVVPLADELEADARRVAELGGVDPLLLLTALKAQHGARLRLIDARAAESIGAIRITELIGPAAAPPSATSPDQPQANTLEIEQLHAP